MTWKIIKIVDDYRLVINAGSDDGIKQNDKLVVFDPGEEIFDPDTNESLGTLDTIKCYLKVSDVLKKMCVCENAESDKTSSLNPLAAAWSATLSASLLGIAAGAMPVTSSKKSLPINAEDISGGLKPKTKIRMGDLVRMA